MSSFEIVELDLARAEVCTVYNEEEARWCMEKEAPLPLGLRWELKTWKPCSDSEGRNHYVFEI